MSSVDFSYIMLERLYASLQVGEVVTALQEGLINLVGSEDFTLFVRDDNSRRFEEVLSTGRRPAMPQSFVTGEGVLGATAAAAKIRYGDPVAVVPLMSGRRIGSVGVVVIGGLLAHKRELTSEDHDLLEVLSRHGGLALEAAICASAAPGRVCLVERLRQEIRAAGTVLTSPGGGPL
jgi:hypothetical protein